MDTELRYEIGADYLTTTWHDEIGATALGSLSTVVTWAEKLGRSRGKGDFVKPWVYKGYRGYRIGQVSIGERPDGTILMLSGRAAHDWLSSGLPYGHNVSRFDIMLTIWGVYDIDARIALHKDDALYHSASLPHTGYKVRTVNSYGDGDTLYSGSRTSSYYVRVYNKEREQANEDAYKTAIRYEAECHNEYAKQAIERCVTNGYTPAHCWEVLAPLLGGRGICPVVRGVKAGALGFTSALPVTSMETALRWLETQVRPTVRRLIREGYFSQAMDALGVGVNDE